MKTQKRITITLIMALTMVMLLPSVLATAQLNSMAGSGTDNDPYIITTAEDLHAIRNDLAASYILSKDIDLSNFLAKDEIGWQPIGSSLPSAPFTGSFDGGNHKITGLWIDIQTNKMNTGFFGSAYKAQIKSLVLVLSDTGINGNSNTGGLIGKQEVGSVEDCYVFGKINGGNTTGGLVGLLVGGKISGSGFEGDVFGANQTGGLLGSTLNDENASNCYISNCYAKGSVNGADKSGGLVGSQTNCSITYSYACGNVSGSDFCGGLVGRQENGIAENCYAGGNVSGKRSTGGLIGLQASTYSNRFESQCALRYCYATGNVVGNECIGGLVGEQVNSTNTYLTNCFFSGSVTGKSDTAALVGQQFKYYVSTGSNKFTESIIEILYCYRLDTVTVNGKTIPADNKYSVPYEKHGGIKSALELSTKSTYESIKWKFGTNSPWYWDKESYPKLGLGTESNPFSFAHKITYNLNGGTLPEDAAQTYIAGQELTLPIPQYLTNDMPFLGWYDNAAGSGQPVSKLLPADSGNKEFWALWQETKTDTPIAKPTAATVLVNGRAVSFDAYNISGNNYFKLRDLAYTLNNTKKQFAVGWDGANNAISLTAGQPYTAVGGEMAGKETGDKIPIPTAATFFLNMREVSFTAYNIEDNNYFKLRDIGQALNFSVEWDEATNTISINTNKEYVFE